MMVTKKEFLMNIGLVAIAVNVFVMLIAPILSETIYDVLRETSIALFGTGLILIDILLKMMDKKIFKNTDITTLGTFFLVFWGLLGTFFGIVPESVSDFVMDWGLLFSGMFLIISVNVIDMTMD